jgi:hypothetical protein
VLMFKRSPSAFTWAMRPMRSRRKRAVTWPARGTGLCQGDGATWVLSARRVAGVKGRAIGRIEILPDPPALAHPAEWMTQAALRRKVSCVTWVDRAKAWRAARLDEHPEPFLAASPGTGGNASSTITHSAIG